MDITLKSIEEINLTKTQEKIILLISNLENNETTLRYIDEQLDVIYATLCTEIKKLISKDILIVDGCIVKVTKFGLKIINYYKFKINILKEFCNKNNIDEENYYNFIKSKNYNNLKLLLGIKNLLN